MSSITVKGTIEYQQIGLGTWALVSETGETYELKNPPPELCQSGLKVQVRGVIREDVMTVAMIGPVLEVESFEAVSD